jgi:hypothetical protein
VMRIGLVGCVKKKRQVTLPARDLYISTLFRGRRKYVERSCDRWFILSAKHGLLDPGVNVAPYDLRIDDLTVAERREWSQRVLVDLKNSFGELRGYTFEVHAGQKYLASGLMAGLRARGAQVENPVSGLAFGKQLRFYRLAHPPVPGTVASAERFPYKPRPTKKARPRTLDPDHPVITAERFHWKPGELILTYDPQRDGPIPPPVPSGYIDLTKPDPYGDGKF